MSIFNTTPNYKAFASIASSNAMQPAQPSSGLSGLFGGLFGSTPTYKTVNGQAATPPASSSWWQFGTAPVYKTVPPQAVPPVDAPIADVPPADFGGAPVMCERGPDQIVIL